MRPGFRRDVKITAQHGGHAPGGSGAQDPQFWPPAGGEAEIQRTKIGGGQEEASGIPSLLLLVAQARCFETACQRPAAPVFAPNPHFRGKGAIGGGRKAVHPSARLAGFGALQRGNGGTGAQGSADKRSLRKGAVARRMIGPGAERGEADVVGVFDAQEAVPRTIAGAGKCRWAGGHPDAVERNMADRLLKPHDFPREAAQAEPGVLHRVGAVEKINRRGAIPVRRIPVALERPFGPHRIAPHPIDVNGPGIGEGARDRIVHRMLEIAFHVLLVNNGAVEFIVEGRLKLGAQIAERVFIRLAERAQFLAQSNALFDDRRGQHFHGDHAAVQPDLFIEMSRLEILHQAHPAHAPVHPEQSRVINPKPVAVPLFQNAAHVGGGRDRHLQRTARLKMKLDEFPIEIDRGRVERGLRPMGAIGARLGALAAKIFGGDVGGLPAGADVAPLHAHQPRRRQIDRAHAGGKHDPAIGRGGGPGHALPIQRIAWRRRGRHHPVAEIIVGPSRGGGAAERTHRHQRRPS